MDQGTRIVAANAFFMWYRRENMLYSVERPLSVPAVC
jgi:hypothetical protein